MLGYKPENVDRRAQVTHRPQVLLTKSPLCSL